MVPRKHVEAGGADGPGARRVFAQLADARHHLLAVLHRPSGPVVVEREGDVAELVGQPLGPGAGVIIEPGPLVAHEDRRSEIRAVVGEGEAADHGAAVGVVGDVAGGCHGRNVSGAGASHTGPVRGDLGRRPQWAFPAALALLAPLALLVASCGSGPSSPQAGRAQHGTSTSAPGGGSGNAGTTTTVASASTLPPVPTSGPLQAGSPIALPFSADRVTAAESPDGAVFAAPQDPTKPGPSVAWVIDGNGPAAVAEHIANGIAALAADAGNFYVATYANVSAYNRASGNQDGQWNMPKVSAANSSDDDLVSMTAAAGSVLLSVTDNNVVRVYRLDPGSSAGPRLVVRGLGAAFGTDGSIYYERDDHHLVALRPNGATVTGPVLAHTPNGLGGGVQYLDAVAAGTVWVDQPAGQGLDALFTTYDATTLATLGSYTGSVTSTVADTAAGPLVLEPVGGTAACPPASPPTPASCVLRIDQHGGLTDPVTVGAAVTLIGPAPAVVVSDTSSGQFDLVRLS